MSAEINYETQNMSSMLFAQLAGVKVFTKLDLSEAYQQLVLDEESKKYIVINTHCGLFRYNDETVWNIVGSWNFPTNNVESPSKNLQSRCLPG